MNNYTEEEKKAIKRERNKKWYQVNREKIKSYYQKNKNKILEYNREYNKTPMGRAHGLIRAYAQEDKKYNRGECDLTAKWIVENIFTKPCAHCGISRWEVIGYNRIDNYKPHTKDNVEPCCGKCNVMLHQNSRDSLGRYIQ